MATSAAFEAWQEWKLRCALGLCSASAQAALCEFAAVRFRAYLSKYAFRTNVEDATDLMADAEDAWHLFESHFEIHNCIGGKRYKDWLFDRAGMEGDSSLEAIEAGATLMLRDVVREHLRREYSPPQAVSLDQPLTEGADAPSLSDLLPGGIDPAGEAERREFERLAHKYAARFIGELRDRERIALLAKQLGVSLAHPEVVRAADCAKSMINQAYRDFVVFVCARLQADYPDDDREAVLMLALMTLEEINRAVLLWAKSENRCAALFLISEQTSPGPAGQADVAGVPRRSRIGQ